jgi:hypothetical protein
MPSSRICTPSRAERVVVCLALTSLALLASCAPLDSVEPNDCPGTPCLSAKLSPGPAPEFFVSPDGSPSGDGSFAKPWDLATALDGPAQVTPGSTIWLRGGTYANGPAFDHGYLSTLTGTPDAPIVVRQYPGERATVTKFLHIRGAYTWYWGFEVVHPAPHVGYTHSINNRGPGTKLINLVVHDASASGIFIGPEATNAEVYGSIAYNNGRIDNLDHGIYCQSESSVLLEDNIAFDNWADGVVCFGKEGPYVQDIDLEGNVAFNNYVWGEPSGADIFVGGWFPASGITIDQNYTYRTKYADTKAADIGYNLVVNRDLVFTDNYFVGGWMYVGAWTTATVTGNTLYSSTRGGMIWNLGKLGGQTWSGNTFFGDSTAVAWRYTPSVPTFDNGVTTTFNGWLTLTGFADPGTYADSVPTDVKVMVRPNRYEPGRANIIVYNWAQQSSVSVDVAGILDLDDQYVVQHAQDFYGPPVAAGIYTGGVLELPMVSITPPTPLGITTPPAPVTGPTFNVFVLLKTRPRPCVPLQGGGSGICGPRR